MTTKSPPESRVPLLTAAQVARLGGIAQPRYVVRSVPGRIVLGPRKLRWRLEALEALWGVRFADHVLQDAGVVLPGAQAVRRV